ncbi:laccase domain protein [Polymorphobacter multimanifer]|uniref:peptidoglycan editing factor PgeF n=1 Tax=Polymorphobacter multimanifer TaxID=1070431 RepID=UPI001668C998|nr:peptidoglycan editing factor PgeF [Polymorphobacter multimanifer]GGI90352.1 laccase domain protein [Polymorphobacter multimanifer]
MTEVPFVSVPQLATPHGFLTRQGGTSTGLYASLNVGLGSDDTFENVRENRRRAVAAATPGAALATLPQVHSCDVITITTPFPDADRPHADAMVSNTPGVALGILTADCAPILFHDAKAKVIGAAHSGWKGTLGNIAAATVDAMVALGAAPERITAAIGPCIQRASYEVDDAFRDRFLAQDPEFAHFFTQGRPGHAHFDMPGLIALSLARAGVRTLITTGHDTLTNPDLWFSYRRTTHRAEPDYGRQISLIALASA